MLTIDSANAVHITVHEMALFLRGKKSELIHHPFFSSFEWLSHCMCMQAGMWTRGCLLRYQEADRRWDGSLPLHSFSLRGLRCYQQCQGSVYSTAVLGQSPFRTAQNQSTQEIRWPTAWQGGVLGMLFRAEQQLEVPWRRQSGCKSGINQVHVLVSNIMGDNQRKSFWGVRDPRYVMVSILWYCFVCWLDWAVPLSCCFLVGSWDLCSRWVFLSWLKRQSCIAF